MAYGLHKYWVMNNGEVIHDDYVNDLVIEDDDFTWPNKAYTIDADKLPPELVEDNERLSLSILAYHHKESEKPEWIVEQ